MGDIKIIPAYGAFVVVTDMPWCSTDPNLPLENPFPFWLYGNDLDYLANVLSSKALDRVVYRIQISLGMRQPSDPVGYSDYLVGEKPVLIPLRLRRQRKWAPCRRCLTSPGSRNCAHSFRRCRRMSMSWW